MKRDLYHEIVERWEKESKGDLRKLWEAMVYSGSSHSLMAKRLQKTYKNNEKWQLWVDAAKAPATPGWNLKIKDFNFLRRKGEYVIIMPFNMDQTRLITHHIEAPRDFDRKYIVYSGSRYGKNRNTYAHVYRTKEGRNFMRDTLKEWYS